MPFFGLLTAGAVLGAGTSIFKGFSGSNAATKAANAQKAALLEAMGYTKEQVDRAINYVGNAADNSIDWVGKAAGDAQQVAMDTGNKVAQNATEAARIAVAGVDTATSGANATLADVLRQQQGNLDPYLTAGKQGVESLASSLAPGGELAKKFSFGAEDMTADPGYQFRMNQGQLALERSAAAKGSGLGGGQVKASLQYGQDYGSQEYGKAYSRAEGTFNTNRDYLMKGYTSLADIGQRGTLQSNTALGDFGLRTSENTIGAGKFAGNAGIGAAQFGGNTLADMAKFYGTAGMHGADTAADILNTAARFKGSTAMSGMQTITDLLRSRGDVEASGIMGKANAIGGAVSGTNKSLQDMISLLLFGKPQGAGAMDNPNGSGVQSSVPGVSGYAPLDYSAFFGGRP